MAPIRAIVTDIEGTTSAIAFVHDVLFPYARGALPAYVRTNADDPDVRSQLDAAAAEAGVETTDTEAIIRALLHWIDEDRKVTPLKALQGLVWEAGYETGAYRGHVHADAVEALRSWHAAGLPLYVYSSGSVHAQQLLFAHTEHGDLSPLLAGHFDTTTGPKREAASYRAIAEAVGCPPGELLFLSDVREELDAAAEAGLQTAWVIRPEDGTAPPEDPAASPHPIVAKLTDIDVGRDRVRADAPASLRNRG